MSQSPFTPEGIQFAWNSSSLKLAEECLAKYNYVMLQGWQTENESVHLRFGRHYARALESFHKAIAEGVEREQAIADVVAEALIDTWDHEKDEAGEAIEGTGTPWNPLDANKTRPNLIRSIIWYLDHFKDDAAKTVILGSGAPAVEHSVTIEVDNGILFTGHLDRLVTYAGNIYVQDQKTSKNTLSASYFEGFSPDIQMSMYTLLGKSAFGIPIHGVMIDAAQIAVGFTRFERGFTFRSVSQLNEWYDHMMLTIERAQHATREQYFPMNRTACGNYGGCMFRRVCSRSPEVRENFLKADYIRGTPMNPLEQR